MQPSFVRRTCRVLLLAAALTTMPAHAQSAANGADARLRQLYETEWEWRMNEQARRNDGVPRGQTDRLPRVDAESQRQRLAYWERTLAQLDAIPLDQISAEERINAAVFRESIQGLIIDVRYRTYEAPISSNNFFWTAIAPRPGSSFDTADDFRRYISRIRDLPRYFGEHVANMRAGLARGFSVPRVTLQGRDETIVPFTADSEDNPLYAPLRRMPDTIAAEEQARIRAEAMTAIREVGIPAYRDLLAFIRDEYMLQARATVGASEMPDGEAYYQAMVRKHTTLEITPRQIHDLGLSEVARIRAEMDQVIARTGFTGTFDEFTHFLRTDPQFYARTPNELLGYASYVVMRAQGQLRNVIGTLPRYRHGIVPIPAELAPINTGGRGGLQNCQFNTYNLPARPLYTMPALAVHECTPGHSFQAALALEGPDRPEFRQQTSFTGYGEGWGLYTEWLGIEMGIYQTPYEDFGRLTYEMWRAVRLVVDTGIHAFGWERDRAIAYLTDNTALANHEIVTEIDRYISNPGQAVAYKLGELQIRRHRAEAEAALGERFDPRTFHDAILQLGSVPLPVLEERMQRFITEARAATPN